MLRPTIDQPMTELVEVYMGISWYPVTSSILEVGKYQEGKQR